MRDLSHPDDLVRLFEKYNQLVYRYIYVRVNRRKELAEDLTQGVFLKVWEKRAQYDTKKASLKTWLMRIARNTLIDHYRAAKKEDLTLDIEVGSDHEFDQEIMFDFIVERIGLLSELDRDLIVMRYIDEMDIKEISLVLNKGYGATKISIYRALDKLRKILNEKIQ
ncbi:MAG: RNA polymerase sigma factor [Candidatus Dojkabacteria bacterium]